MDRCLDAARHLDRRYAERLVCVGAPRVVPTCCVEAGTRDEAARPVYIRASQPRAVLRLNQDSQWRSRAVRHLDLEACCGLPLQRPILGCKRFRDLCRVEAGRRERGALATVGEHMCPCSVAVFK